MTDSTDRQGAARPLRFGIMCRGPVFSAWEALCIRNLLAVHGVEAALLIVEDSPPPAPVGRAERLRSLFDPRTLLWRLYQRLVLNRRSQSTQPVDLSAELAGVPTIRCRPRQFGKWVQRLEADDVVAIREHRLDFVMRFAFNILRGDVLDSARHGIWSFHHDDPDLYRGQPPGFWEIYRGDPVTGTVLQRLTEQLDSGIMLHRGWFRTDAASYPRSRDAIFLGAADWPARLCRQLQAGDETAFAVAPLSGKAPLYRAPDSLEMLRFLWIWAKAVAGVQFHSLFGVQQWSVAVIDAPIAEVAGLTSPGATAPLVRGASWLPEPTGRFLADPFGIAGEDGGLTILAEDFDWSTGRGHIAAVTRQADGTFTRPEPVIRTDWHLSYPYVLQVEDDLYCIPEMSEAGLANLYRAGATPGEWREAGTVIAEVAIVDPTIFRHDGRWWLFGTRADHDSNLKLFGWHGPSPTGPWTPHTANPLKTDIRSSRPAGPPFLHAGALYRPAQDCSTGYGAAVAINRMVWLTPDHFEEELVSRIAPDPAGPYPTGLHTLCAAGDRTIIDGSRSGFVPAAARAALKQKLARLVGRR